MQHIVIKADHENISGMTTLLQSGILLECRSGISIGRFLNQLPGFDMDYIVNRIQTIFYNGNALDDLETRITGPHPVLALSAAMPGLAGAIFRRNSLCAALRIQEKNLSAEDDKEESLHLRLKLFNMIARERGPALLGEKGGIFSGKILRQFFSERQKLLENISHFTIDARLADSSRICELIDDEDYFVTATQI